MEHGQATPHSTPRPAASTTPGETGAPVVTRRRISIRQISSNKAVAGADLPSSGRRASIRPRLPERSSSNSQKAGDIAIDVAPTLKGNALELIDRWKTDGFKNRFKPEEQLHRFQVLCRYVPRAVALPILLTGQHAAGSASSADAVRSRFFGVVLLSDISGFTQLAADLAKQPTNSDKDRTFQQDSMQKMGGERLATILNTVFSIFIDIILRNGGDVTKFAGDALLSVFRPTGSSPDEFTKCGLTAAKAALELQSGMKLLQNMNIRLEVHSGLSAGVLHELHFGGFESRWEYMFAGQPIFEMGRALEAAIRGEVVIQSSVFELIKGFCQVRQRDDDLFLLESVDTGALPAIVDPMLDLMQFLSQTKICRSVESALACYLPRSVTLAINAGKQGLIGERRQVSMVFINLPDFHYNTDKQIQANQSAFRLIQQALHRYDGTLRQLIQDDKGTVAIAAFGLPYNAHDDDAIRAVQASLTIQSLLLEMGMQTGIGVTTGGAFCGSVGDEVRCEYAIVGDIVNLSARLMVSSHNGFLCDGETQRAALFRGGHSLSIDFAKMAPIKVKGRIGIVQVYHPAARCDSQEQGLEPATTLMLGRSAELALARTMFESVMCERRVARKRATPRTILFVEADGGMGKTRFVQSVRELAHEHQFATLYFTADPMSSDDADLVLWNAILQRLIALLCGSGADGATSYDLLTSTAARSRLTPACTKTLMSLSFRNAHSARGKARSMVCGRGDHPTVKELLNQHLTAFAELYRAVTDACGCICLMLENVRDFDVTSGIYLSHLCRNLPPNMVLVLTSRPIPLSSQVQVLDAQLRHLPYCQHVKLGALSRRDTEALLCLRLHLARFPDLVLDTVHRSSEGNPELILDLAAGLAEANIPTDQFSQTAMDFVQHMFEQNIISHIDRLSPSEQEVLKCASVVGDTFALDLLQSISPYSNDRLMENVASLESKDIVVRTATVPVTTYAFRQPLMQTTVYGLLSKSDSSVYHNLIVAQLERLQQDRLLFGHLDAIPVSSAQLAHHYQCAGQLANAIKYYRLAGDAAFSLGDFNAAAAYSFTAMSLLEQYTPNGRFEIAKTQRSSAKYLFENHEMARCLTLIDTSLINIDTHATSQSNIALIAKARIALALTYSFAGPCRPILPGTFTRPILLERAKSYNMKSNIAFELGNGLLAMKAANRALITSEAARSLEQKLLATTNFMMGALCVGNLKTVSGLFKVIALDMERDTLFPDVVNATPLSHFTKGSVLVKLAHVACATLGEAPRGRQLLQLASDKFTSANSPHHLVRTLDELVSISLLFMNMGEVDDMLQSMESIAAFCEYGWGQRRISILRCVHHLVTGNLAALGQLLQAQSRPDPGDDPKSALQYAVCRMIHDYYEDRADQSLAPIDAILLLTPAASYDLTSILGWACQLPILRYNDLCDVANSDSERRQVVNMASASLRALTRFAKRVPVSKPRALLVEGMFDAIVTRSPIWKATNKWLQALDLATQLGLVYDMALAHRLIGAMGQTNGTGIRTDGALDSSLRAQHLMRSAALARKYAFALILIPVADGNNILTENASQQEGSARSTSMTRDLRLQGYRQSHNSPISDIIDEGYGGDSDQVLLSGMESCKIVVGRDAQLRAMTSLLAQQQGGESIGPVILHGAIGFGKSVIARTFLKMVGDQHDGVRAFTMYGESSYKQQIYLPVIRVLRKLIPEFGKSAGVASIGGAMEVLFNRLPKHVLFRRAVTHMIFNSDGLSDPMLNLLSEVSRAHLFALIFTDLLKAIAGEFRICLLIEDIQWLDTGTWHVLSAYSAFPDPRIFLLGTLQTDDPNPDQYAAAHPEAKHFLSPATHWLYVPPLDRPDIVRLSRHLLSAAGIRSGLEILLVEIAAGSPVRLIDVLLCLQEERLIQVSATSIADLLVEPVEALFAISGSSVDLARKRMNHLSKTQQNLLRLASVIGVSFPFNVLRSLCNQHTDIDDLKSDLMVLKNRGWLLLAHMRTSSPRISFPHSSVQRDVYATLNEESRNRFHIDLAECYEGGSNNNAFALPLIGYHYSQTNQASLDRKFSGLAAAHFSFLFMVNDAIDLFHHCIDLDQGSATYNRKAVTVDNWLNIARLHLLNQDVTAAKPIVLRALDCVGANNRPRPSVAASIFWAQASLMSCQNIRKAPPSRPEQVIAADLYEILAYVENGLGDQEASHWAILQALTIRNPFPPDVLARRYCWLLKVLSDRARLANSAFLDLVVYRIRYWIRRCDGIRTMATCYSLLGQAAGVCGYWRSSIGFLSSAIQLYNGILFDVQESVISLQRLGCVHLISGRVLPSMDAFSQALTLAKPVAFFHPSVPLNCSLLIAFHQLACSQMNPPTAIVAAVERLVAQSANVALDATSQAFRLSVEAVLKYKTGDFAAAYHAAVSLRKRFVGVDKTLMMTIPVAAEVLVSLLRQFRISSGSNLDEMFGIQRRSVIAQAQGAVQLLFRASETSAFARTSFLLWHAALLACKSAKSIDILNLLQLAQRSAVQYAIPSVEGLSHMFMAEIYEDQDANQKYARDHARRAFRLFVETGARSHQDYIRSKFSDLQLHASPEANHGDGADDLDEYLQDNESVSHQVAHLFNIGRVLHARTALIQQDTVAVVVEKALQQLDDDVPDVHAHNLVPIFDEVQMKGTMMDGMRLLQVKEQEHGAIQQPVDAAQIDHTAHSATGGDGDDDALLDEWDLSYLVGHTHDDPDPIQPVRNARSGIYDQFLSLRSALCSEPIRPVSECADQIDRHYAGMLPRPIVLSTICTTTSTDEGDDGTGHCSLIWAVILNISIISVVAPDTGQHQRLFSAFLGCARRHQGALLDLSSSRLVVIWDVTPSFTQSMICTQAVNCAFHMRKQLVDDGIADLFHCKFCLSCDDCVLLETIGADSARGYVCIGPALSEAYRIEAVADVGQIVAHKSLLKLLRISGHVVVKQEFDDKRCAIVQSFASSAEVQCQGVVEQVIALGRQHHIFHEDDQLILQKFSKKTDAATSAQSLNELVIVAVRVDIPTDPAIARVLIASLAFELQTVRLSEPSCVFASVSSSGMRLMAIASFRLRSQALAFLFAFRIRARMADEFGTECGVGIGTGLCWRKCVAPFAIPIISGDALNSALLAVSLATNQILIDEVTQETFDSEINTGEYSSGDNARLLQYHFVLKSLRSTLPLHIRTCLLVSGRVQLRAMLQDVVIRDQVQSAGALYLVSASRGAGKTSLLSQIHRVSAAQIDCTRQDIALISLFATRTRNRAPGSGIRSLLRQYFQYVCSHQFENASMLRARLLQVVMKVRPPYMQVLAQMRHIYDVGFDRQHGGPAAPASDSDVAQIVAVLMAMTLNDRKRVVMMIDDIDAVDDLSIACLDELLVQLPNLIVIATCSEAPDTCAAKFGGEFKRDLIHLPAMSHDDIALLACLRLGGLTPSHLFVDYVVNAVQSSTSADLAVICFCASRLCNASRRIAEANARPSEERINRIISAELTTSQSAVLAVCSVVRPKFDADLLLHVLNSLAKSAKDATPPGLPTTLPELAESLRVLVDQWSLLVQVPAPEGKKGRTLLFAFRSDEIGQKVYANLEIEYRRRLHGLVAITLEQIRADDDEALAGHWRIARHFDRSMHYQVKAARRYRRTQKLQQAITLYRAAITSGSLINKRRVSITSQPNMIRIETIYLELAECLLITDQHSLAIEAVTLALEKITRPIPSGRSFTTAWNQIRLWAGSMFPQESRQRPLNRIAPEVVPDTEFVIPSSALFYDKAAIASRLYLVYAQACTEMKTFDQALDAALRALDLCRSVDDDVLFATVTVVAVELFIWKGWIRLTNALIDRCRPFAVVTVQSAVLDIVKGKFALAEPKLRSCSSDRMLIDNPTLARRFLLVQSFLAILQEDQATARSSLSALERISRQVQSAEASHRQAAAVLQAFVALQRHQLDRCTELLLDDHNTDHELPIAGQAILAIVFLRLGQVSKAAAWFGTLILEYSAESHVRTWYDLLDHVLVAEYLVQILIDNARSRPRQQLSVVVSSRKVASDDRRRILPIADDDLSEAKRNLGAVVKKLKEFASRYHYARGIAELYAGCFELIDTRSDHPDQFTTNTLQRAVSILEATDMRFFDARARFIIGSHYGYGDDRDHDMLLDARQYFSLSQSQYYLELVDDALQRRPSADLFSKNRFREDRLMPNIVIEAMATAFRKRASHQTASRTNLVGADSSEHGAGESYLFSTASNDY